MAAKELIFDEFLKRVCPPRQLNWRKYRRASQCKVLSRIYELGLRGYAEYAEYIDSNPAEQALLPNLLRVTVSRFFREKEVWNYLASDILPAMINKIQRPLKILHIGCCGGEEPYSMALLWKTEIEPIFPDARVGITALDIDQSCLERAQKGWYAPKTLREVPEKILHTWFKEHKRGYLIDQRITDMVRFKRFDLLSDSLPMEQDIIFCRYLVFTYYQGQRLQEMIQRITRAFSQQGVLVMGQKEPLESLNGRLLTPMSDSVSIFRMGCFDEGNGMYV